MKRYFLIILFIAALVGGSFFAQKTVFAQVLGGKILFYHPLSILDPFQLRHEIGPPRPSILPVICPMCMGPVGVGRWFLGRAIGGTVIIGGLGGL